MKQYINLQRDHYSGIHEHCNCYPETCIHPNGRVLKTENRVMHFDQQGFIGAEVDDKKFAVITSILNGDRVLILYLNDINNHLISSSNSVIKLTPREKPLTKEEWEERVRDIETVAKW